MSLTVSPVRDGAGRLLGAAKVARDVPPQAYISQVQARQACESAGKRLCKPAEYLRACRGTNKNDLYPYGGMQRRPGLCNEGKGSFVALAFGQNFFKLTYENFNDPKLDQMPGGLARTGRDRHRRVHRAGEP